MLTNPHLDNLIQKETFAEMLASLTPKQLAVVALRLDDLSYQDTERALGLTRGCVYGRLVTARTHIPELFPHVQTLLERTP